MTDDNQSAASSDVPDAVQDIPTEKLTGKGYPMPASGHESERSSEPEHRDRARGPRTLSDPGRMRNDESIDASSIDTPRDDEGYAFSTDPEMKAATGVGKPGKPDPHYDEQRQKMNDGRDPSDGTLSHRQAAWDKKRIARALCSDLPISKRQREQVVAAMEQLDLDRFGYQKAIERVCLGVVAVIVNDQRVEQGSTPDDVTLVSWEDQFREIATKFDVGMSDLSTIKKIVREELGDQPPEPAEADTNRDPNLPDIPPAEQPDEYWDRQPSRYWIRLARYWERYDADLKAALPEEKRKLVDLLRTWEPRDEASVPAENQSTDDDSRTTSDGDGAVNATDESCEEDQESISVDDDIRAEAEAMIERITDDAADDRQ